MASVEIKGATLMKRSRNRSVLSIGVNWQLRRVSLTETKITYGTPDGPPKDFVSINEHTTCDAWSGEGKEHAFRIQTGADELILCGTSEQDCKEWIESVRKVANPPPPVATGNAELDRANAEAHEKALQAQRMADEAEKAAHSGAMPNIPSMSLEGAVTSALGSGAAEAAARALEEAEKEAAKKLAEEEAAKKLAEEEAKKKAALFKKLESPVQCEKKLAHESAYHPRFIWVNRTTKEFHWAKTNDASKSKSISIPKHVKSVGAVGEVGAHNFTVELKDHESVFSGGMFSTVPSGLDVKLEDGNINNAFIELIKELMV